MKAVTGNYIDLKKDYPETIAGAFDALAISYLNGGDFEAAKKDILSYQKRDSEKMVKEAEQEILTMKTHLEAGFIKEGPGCRIRLASGNDLYYNPFEKIYWMLIDDSDKTLNFKERKPQSAIYFANNVII